MGLSNSKKLVELAAKGKEKEAIKLLSDKYLIDPNYKNSVGDTALHLCCANNLMDLTDKLLQFDIEINKRNKFESAPLHIATRMGHIQIVRLLLKKCAKQKNHSKSSTTSPYELDINLPSYHGINAVTISASCNNLAITRLLLDHGGRIQDGTLLYGALHDDGDEICRILLNHGCNVNATDEYGNTALMQACHWCNEKVVNVLVSREWIPPIDINKQNQFGWTALHFAYSYLSNNKHNKNKERNKANIINKLLKKGANINIKNDHGIKASDIKPQIVEKYDIDKPVPNKKRRLNNGKSDHEQNKINKNLTEQFDIIHANSNRHNHNNKKHDDDEYEEETELEQLSEFDNVEEDPYDNYEPPKRQNNKKRGRKKQTITVTAAKRATRKRRK